MSPVMVFSTRDVPHENHPGALVAATGARSARLLGEACRTALASGGPPLRLEVVRNLAADLERELDALARSEEAPTDLLAEAALRCADLATLAACNAGAGLPEAGAVVHLAAGAARALRLLVEAESDSLGSEHAENVLRDVRGVGWRVDLAVRQIEAPQSDEG
jgi:hypothetical protein